MGDKGHVGRTIVYLPTARRPVPDLFQRADLPRALTVLMSKAAVAAVNSRSDAALLATQRDIVTGAQRLEAACEALGDCTDTYRQVIEYRQAAEEALARMEARLPAPSAPRQLESG